jgi:hypothetical protein
MFIKAVIRALLNEPSRLTKPAWQNINRSPKKSSANKELYSTSMDFMII